jgi:hypothetical protein
MTAIGVAACGEGARAFERRGEPAVAGAVDSDVVDGVARGGVLEIRTAAAERDERLDRDVVLVDRLESAATSARSSRA